LLVGLMLIVLRLIRFRHKLTIDVTYFGVLKSSRAIGFTETSGVTFVEES